MSRLTVLSGAYPEELQFPSYIAAFTYNCLRHFHPHKRWMLGFVVRVSLSFVAVWGREQRDRIDCSDTVFEVNH